MRYFVILCLLFFTACGNEAPPSSQNFTGTWVVTKKEVSTGTQCRTLRILNPAPVHLTIYPFNTTELAVVFDKDRCQVAYTLEADTLATSNGNRCAYTEHYAQYGDATVLVQQEQGSTLTINDDGTLTEAGTRHYEFVFQSPNATADCLISYVYTYEKIPDPTNVSVPSSVTQLDAGSEVSCSPPDPIPGVCITWVDCQGQHRDQCFPK